LAPSLQGRTDRLCDLYQLEPRLRRVLPGGASESLRQPVYNAAQLKTIQEVITFVVFAGFSYLYLQEPITLSQGFGFALIATGAFFVFHTW
jgi:hypothetical protein